MKLLYPLLFSVVFLAACQGTPDTNNDLTALKEQQKQINDRIKELEKTSGGAADARAVKETAVEAMPLKAETFTHVLEVQGKADATDNVAVSPQQPGIVSQVLVAEGQNVKKGQLLATLNSDVFNQSVAELQTQIDLANILYQKQKSLWDQKIGTEVQYLQAKANKDALERKTATLRQQAELYNIYAPISGTLEEVNVKVGEGAGVGSPIPPFRIISLGNLKVQADVAETYVNKIKKGDNVSLFFPDLNKSLNAKITNISTLINNIGRTFSIEMRIPATAGVKPNMIAMIKINDYSVANAIVIPLNTVQNSEEGQYVFVADEQAGKKVVRKQIIETGLTNGDRIEVKKGLRSGDMLITTGYQDIAPGQVVTF
jgi:membrane fusion protein (multidrug efflux system)